MRAWYSIIDNYFTKQGFRRSKREPMLYIKDQGMNKTLIVSLYVDDLIHTGNNEKMIHDFKGDMMKTFEMTDFIAHKKYTKNLIKNLKINGCKTVSTPLDSQQSLKLNDETPKLDSSIYWSLIGSLPYLTITRPDIMYSTSLLSGS